MGELSISKAWTETGQFLAREAGLVLPIALLLIALPPAAQQLLIPPPDTQTTLGQAGLAFVTALVTLVTSLIGGIAISHLALTPGASVGEALRRGVSRFLPMLGASLLVAIPLSIVAVILVMTLAPGLATMRDPLDPATIPPALAWIVIVLTIMILVVWVKLSMATPVASEEQAGPVRILTRSWELTKGNYWRLFGTFLALMLVSSLVIMALSRGLGVLIFLAAGPPVFGAGSFIAITLIDILLQTVMVTVLIVLVARIYAQLSGRTGA